VQEVARTFDSYWNDRWSFPIGMLTHKKASAEQLAEAQQVTAAAQHLHEELPADALILHWRDLVATADTGDAFLFADLPPEENPKDREEAPVQVANELVALFDNAQTEILIVSAYLIPTDHLQQAIKRALDRGVRVAILTNSIGSNNHLTAHSAYRNHINTLLSQGADLHEVRTDAKGRNRYMLDPVDAKKLALHAKALVIDDDKVFVGSANLDPRSLRINTEMGFLVISEAFNRNVRTALQDDFSTENAWRLEMQDDGSVNWVADDKVLESEPALSGVQRLEDWFFSNLPIEDEL
jgi:putative cardiolipin synthase